MSPDFSRIFFLSVIIEIFFFYECGMDPNDASKMIGIVFVFTFPTFLLFKPFVRFFGCLMFFSPPVGILELIYSILFRDDIRFVDWNSSVSVDLLIV